MFSRPTFRSACVHIVLLQTSKCVAYNPKRAENSMSSDRSVRHMNRKRQSMSQARTIDRVCRCSLYYHLSKYKMRLTSLPNAGPKATSRSTGIPFTHGETI
ncbi:uncharacterized protein BDZ83DRAFT_609088, partial [Colletotrichum acutatum]